MARVSLIDDKSHPGLEKLIAKIRGGRGGRAPPGCAMKVLMALSGGVDSSVAAAELLADGHDVVGITMRLWGGDSDTGCCSVADVDDARRVAQQLGIDHLVFNFTEDFHRHVVDPYVEAHRTGITPNPCIECNRHLKFDRLAERADVLGFDAVATGHHARIVEHDGAHLARVDAAALEIVDEPAGRRDDDGRGGRERAAFVAVVRAADDRSDPRPERREEPRKLSLDLLCELARRRDHESARAARSGGGGCDDVA
jgi:hypothetical protein